MLYAKKDHERLYHGSYKRKKGKRTKECVNDYLQKI
jgi:hypothetical protein